MEEIWEERILKLKFLKHCRSDMGDVRCFSCFHVSHWTRALWDVTGWLLIWLLCLLHCPVLSGNKRGRSRMTDRWNHPSLEGPKKRMRSSTMLPDLAHLDQHKKGVVCRMHFGKGVIGQGIANWRMVCAIVYTPLKTPWLGEADLTLLRVS